jgi:hypothetical protein
MRRLQRPDNWDVQKWLARRFALAEWHVGRRIPFDLAPPAPGSLSMSSQTSLRRCWRTRRLVDVEARLERNRKCRWPENKLQVQP